MKKLLAALLLYAALSHAATATFSYTFANPICSSATSTGCVSGFAVGTVAAGVFTQMATCPLPATPSGTMTGITCTFTGNAPLGSVIFAVVATYVSTSGVAGISPLIPAGSVGSNETGVTVTPASPSGVVIIFP